MKISNIICDSYPFNHYSFSDVFCENELRQIEDIDLFNCFASLDGERASNTNRFFANHENRKTHNVIDRIVNYFSDSKTIAHFENESGRKIFGNYLRVEFIADNQASWLKPHVDIEEKIMSMMIYLNTTDEDPNIGTAIYDEDRKLIKTVPYLHNTGFYFYPSHNTWHGLEPIKIKTMRKAIMVNYCTFETEFRV
jgi:hypothetical protein